VAPEVEAENAGRPAKERPVLDEVGCDGAGPAVEQEDRLVGIGAPGAGTTASAALAPRAPLDRKPSPGESEAVARSKPDDLAAERVEPWCERRLILGRSRPREQPFGPTPDHESNGSGR
jgi:hypothetical protein